MQTGGATRDRTGERRPEPVRKGAFEGRQERAERQALGAQNLEDPRALELPEHRGGERDRVLRHPSRAHEAERSGARSIASLRPDCIPYSSESTSASQEASMTFSETPIEPHTCSPS